MGRNKIKTIEKKRINILEAAVVLFSIVMWFAFYYRQCVVDDALDYHAHNLFAALIVDNKMTLVYPLYHYMTGYLAKIFNTDTLHSSIPVLIVLQLMCMYLTAALIKEIAGKWENRGTLILSAFLLNIIQPVFTYGIRPGYSSGNGLVSPTSLACKPFAIWCILIFFREYKANSWKIKTQLELFILLALSCLAKPMFAMAFVPAMGLLLFIDGLIAVKNKEKSLPQAVKTYISQVFPLFATGCLLIVQFAMTSYTKAPTELIEGIRISMDSNTHIRFGFMRTWKIVVSNVYVSILFAYLFPLAVFIVYLLRRKRTDSREIRLFSKMSLVYAIISFSYMAFLYQDNGMEQDANFRNSWIMTFTMVYSLAFVVLNGWLNEEKGKKDVIFPIIVFGVQILFGIALIAKNILT